MIGNERDKRPEGVTVNDDEMYDDSILIVDASNTVIRNITIGEYLDQQMRNWDKLDGDDNIDVEYPQTPIGGEVTDDENYDRAMKGI